MFDEATYQLIDDYLQHRLSAEERKAFEQRLANEKELAQEVVLQQTTRELLLTEDLREKIAGWRRQGEQPKNPSPTTHVSSDRNIQARDRTWRVYLAAAAVIGITTFAWWSWFSKVPKGISVTNEVAERQRVPESTTTGLKVPKGSNIVTDSLMTDSNREKNGIPPLQQQGSPSRSNRATAASNDELLAIGKEYFEQYDTEATQLRNSTRETAEPKEGLNLIFRLYDKGEYAVVVDSLSQNYQERHPQYYQAKLLLADTYFQLGQYEQALAIYRIVQDSRYFTLMDKAEFNILLTQLALGRANTLDFKSLRNKILLDDGHPYYPAVINIDAFLEEEEFSN